MLYRQNLVFLLTHYTQAYVAEYLGVKRPRVSKWKSGGKPIPARYWQRIDQLLSVLRGEVAPPPPADPVKPGASLASKTPEQILSCYGKETYKAWRALQSCKLPLDQIAATVGEHPLIVSLWLDGANCPSKEQQNKIIALWHRYPPRGKRHTAAERRAGREERAMLARVAAKRIALALPGAYKRLRDLQALALPQLTLARALGVTQQKISLWLSGRQTIRSRYWDSIDHLVSRYEAVKAAKAAERQAQEQAEYNSMIVKPAGEISANWA